MIRLGTPADLAAARGIASALVSRIAEVLRARRAELGGSFAPIGTWYFHPHRMRPATGDREILDVTRNPRNAGA